MVGNLLLLLLSWVVLKLSGNGLEVLGLFPTRTRNRQLFLGFLLTAVLAAVYFIGLLQVLDAKVTLNPGYSVLNFLKGTWLTFQSVLYEELLFRGALLFLVIKYFGKLKGILLSATIFGMYHWFSYNVFGDLVQMVFTFVITGVGGFVFAYAYSTTRSLYLPIGLHFGWNFVTVVIFSQGPYSDQLLVSSTNNEMGILWSVLSIMYQTILFPATFFLCIRFLTSDKRAENGMRKYVRIRPAAKQKEY